jgi:hypothetical protein
MDCLAESGASPGGTLVAHVLALGQRHSSRPVPASVEPDFAGESRGQVCSGLKFAPTHPSSHPPQIFEADATLEGATCRLDPFPEIFGL